MFGSKPDWLSSAGCSVKLPISSSSDTFILIFDNHSVREMTILVLFIKSHLDGRAGQVRAN